MRFEVEPEITVKGLLLWLLNIAIWFVLLPLRLWRLLRSRIDDPGMFWKMPLIYLMVFAAISLVAALLFWVDNRA